MKNDDTFYPGFNDENLDRDKKMKDDLDGNPAAHDLKYDPDTDSYEIQVESDDPDYDPPALFDTAAPSGSDFDSSYDEANPYDTLGEYDKNRSLETDADQLGMHIDDGKITELDPVDEMLARTPEDDRDDLDEEGYPKNDSDINGADKDVNGSDDNEYLK
ncbi:hypothetical protein HH214_04590 [Mucilaginibacter robiniae]|uniref:Uncharacterized protein n=1 Tax=Mucilaginibacter robiniae TaxID=2728022 RepID=A0A7L5E4C9_9SPHI|nr:hypothetical protein [Mucilaginibacter robiniae]QJD95206.1 hypothetical protein HH214_04590 [Mucilaginibacter robiniae]